MSQKPTVLYREFWGTDKRAALLASLETQDFDTAYEGLAPTEANRFLLRPGAVTADYTAWPDLQELSASPDWSGLLEMRHGALISDDLDALDTRIRHYCDASRSFAAVRPLIGGLGQDAARFNAEASRSALLMGGGWSAGRVARIALYPFDDRWCFHTNIRPVWNEPRPEVAQQQAIGNAFLVTRARCRRPVEGYPCAFTRHLPGYHLLDPNSHVIPLVIDHSAEKTALGIDGAVEPNLSAIAREWLRDLGLAPDQETSRMVWHHALAITYTPAYLAENAAGIRQGWPHIPLPNDAGLLRRSAALGARLAALLDPDAPVEGVTHGRIRQELAVIAVPHGHDYALTAGWGTRTDKGITMPGRGRIIERRYSEPEAVTARHAELLGTMTRDVYLNAESFWANIPNAVWETHIGGYQVIKKWLSYREKSIIKRALTPEEVLHVTQTTRRLAAILLLGPELDESYRACAAAHRALAAVQTSATD